jgi:hypothetical protein
VNETQRKRRGHAFLPPKAVLRKIPKLSEWHLLDARNDEWYCTVIDKEAVPYWLDAYSHMFPGVYFKVEVVTYGTDH